METMKKHCGNCNTPKERGVCAECLTDKAQFGRFSHWEPRRVEPFKHEGVKHDAGKARYDLIPADALEGLAHMYTQGAEKYGDYNWELGMDWHRLYAALQRHANKWWRGEAYDREDGQHHLLSVIWCAMTLYAYEGRGLGRDDRPDVSGCNPEFWRKQDDPRSAPAQ